MPRALNVAFSDAGVTPKYGAFAFGDVRVCGTNTSADGRTVRGLLAFTNSLLSFGPVSTINEVYPVLSDLNAHSTMARSAPGLRRTRSPARVPDSHGGTLRREGGLPRRHRAAGTDQRCSVFVRAVRCRSTAASIMSRNAPAFRAWLT